MLRPRPLDTIVQCFLSTLVFLRIKNVASGNEVLSAIIHRHPPLVETASRHEDTVTNTITSFYEADRGDQLQKMSRMIGGVEAEDGRYPYAVSIQMNDAHFCGGTLIAEDVVLTAAHCSVINTYTVLVGSQNLANEGDADRVEILEVITHPNFYKNGTWEYDFALLILSRPTTASAQLVKLNADSDFPPSETSSMAMGWGDLEEKSNEYVGSDVLMIVEADVISNDDCSVAHGMLNGYHGSYESLIFPSMICTLSKKQNACKGDSGGPLVVLGDDSVSDIQIGVISWSLPAGCATKVFPVVYSRISSGLEWIKEVTCNKSTLPPGSLCETSGPTSQPTMTKATEGPSIFPSTEPSSTPTLNPTFSPSDEPTAMLSSPPTGQPTQAPSTSSEPSSVPSESPSVSLPPSISPSFVPSTSSIPSNTPSTVPSISSHPSLLPSYSPSLSSEPTSRPTASPTRQPSSKPSSLPSFIPSLSLFPSIAPTNYTSLHKSFLNNNMNLTLNDTKPKTSSIMELTMNEEAKKNDLASGAIYRSHSSLMKSLLGFSIFWLFV